MAFTSQEALRSGKEPDDVLHSQIWRFAGKVLLEVPDCPVQLAQAVRTLMGRGPLPQDFVDSIGQQLSERQTHTRQAMDAIMQTGQTMRQQQQSQAAQQQANVDPQRSTDAAASTALQASPAPLQVSIFQQIEQAMAAAASSSQHPEQHSMHMMATHMAAAMMSPVLQALQHRDEVHQAAMRQMSAKVDNLSQQLQRIESKLDSNASFYPLMALTMAQLSHQTHHLAQYLSISSRSGAGSASQYSPAASPRQPVATPQRKQLQRQDNARTKAKKQLLRGEDQPQSDQAILGRSITNGLNTVYPGSGGEAYWCSSMGK